MPRVRSTIAESRKQPNPTVKCVISENSAKKLLAIQLNRLIDSQKLSQVEAASIVGMSQPKISLIRHYRLHNISLERLIQALISLNQDVEIVIRPALNHNRPSITVAT